MELLSLGRGLLCLASLLKFPMKLLNDLHNMTVLEGVEPKQPILPATELGRSLEARGGDSRSTGRPVEGVGPEDRSPVVTGK